jgi:hypothetical protein
MIGQSHAQAALLRPVNNELTNTLFERIQPLRRFDKAFCTEIYFILDTNTYAEFHVVYNTRSLCHWTLTANTEKSLCFDVHRKQNILQRPATLVYSAFT